MDHDNFYGMLAGWFSEKKPTQEELSAFAKTMNDSVCHLSEKIVQESIRRFEKNEGISMPKSEILFQGENTDWFKEFEKTHDLPHFKRYLNYIRSGKETAFANSVISRIKETNEETMNFFADPLGPGIITKKGLVVGDVQAGKTSNYIGLMNLAVDVGYKNIVLLTGSTEDLRKQTQKRVDEGFIGAVSSSFLGKVVYTGISEGKESYYAISLTNNDQDFNTFLAKSFNFNPNNDLNKPNIFVIKKNNSVLNSIIKTITNKYRDKIDASLLIVDDECDFASVNTKPEESPTTINILIRKLLSLFTHTTYVGYSATPYANIFVDPYAEYSINAKEEIRTPDLFPDDFIVLLEPPSNYIGANSLFIGFDEMSNKSVVSSNIRIVDPEHDHNFFKTIHKKTEQFVALSDTLIEAIYIFLLSNCVYTLRGHKTDHRTMLVNISCFNNIQEEIGMKIRSFVSNLKNVVQAKFKENFSSFIQSPVLLKIYNIWKEDVTFNRGYKDMPPANKQFSFAQIQDVIGDEIGLFITTVINGKHIKDRFSYDNYKSKGARVIVIGGFTLSRGLTLCGLMTSYYNRHASAYDTLIQMGRWFGYRPDYEDLVNIYMTQLNADNFCAASIANEDLKEQFRQMKRIHKTPKEFGLMVREAPDTLDNILLITARNKMRNAQDMVYSVDLSGTLIDTSKILKDVTANDSNKASIEWLFSQIQDIGIHLIASPSMNGKKYFKNVPSSLISDFLLKLKISSQNYSFNCQVLSDFISRTSELSLWNVAVAEGKATEKNAVCVDIGQNSYVTVKRSFEFADGKENEDFFRVGGGNNHLIEPNFFSIDFSQEQRKNVLKKCSEECTIGNRKGKDPGAKDWLRESGHNPILIIYPIDLKTDSSNSTNNSNETYDDPKKVKMKEELQGNFIYGYGLGFPGDFKNKKVKYKINIVKQKENNDDNDDIDEDDQSSI